ncbi:MAG: hypothetical protein OXG42_05485 [Chloroflexi bacterium]|nr:hypothetical protein [Chloroflexota bacterium]
MNTTDYDRIEAAIHYLAGGATRKRCILTWEASRQSIGGAETEQVGGAP